MFRMCFCEFIYPLQGCPLFISLLFLPFLSRCALLSSFFISNKEIICWCVRHLASVVYMDFGIYVGAMNPNEITLASTFA